MREQAVEFGSGDVRLGGTLTLPEVAGSKPAVLFLQGSGPLDRDENMPGQRLDIFNTLARHLAGLGIASLRYDKRGCGLSTGSYLTAGQDDFLADAAAAVRHLHEALPGRRVCLLGHSEGTLLAARLSLTHPVDGLVLIAPFLAKIEDVLMDQAGQIETEMRSARGLSGVVGGALIALGFSPRARQRRLIEKLRSTSAPTLRLGGRTIEAHSLRDLLALDPAAIYARVRTPMLLIAGAKDLQCNPLDARSIADIVGPPATVAIIPDLTHILRRDPGPPSFASCARLVSQPMDEEVVRMAGGWIGAR